MKLSQIRNRHYIWAHIWDNVLNNFTHLSSIGIWLALWTHFYYRCMALTHGEGIIFLPWSTHILCAKYAWAAALMKPNVCHTNWSSVRMTHHSDKGNPVSRSCLSPNGDLYMPIACSVWCPQLPTRIHMPWGSHVNLQSWCGHVY